MADVGPPTRSLAGIEAAPALSIRILSVLPAAMITVFDIPAVPATEPIIVLLLPVVSEDPATRPMPILIIASYTR